MISAAIAVVIDKETGEVFTGRNKGPVDNTKTRADFVPSDLDPILAARMKAAKSDTGWFDNRRRRGEGERHYLWRAVDHEGEVLECFVSKRRIRKAALKFLRKAIKRFGRPEVLVTDKRHSYRAALRDLSSERLQCTDRWRTIVLKTHTSHFDDGNARCRNFDDRAACNNSSRSTHQSKTILANNAISSAG